eukprot:355142-Chlamydomonas_euryale.AAC.7
MHAQGCKHGSDSMQVCSHASKLRVACMGFTACMLARMLTGSWLHARDTACMLAGEHEPRCTTARTASCVCTRGLTCTSSLMHAASVLMHMQPLYLWPLRHAGPCDDPALAHLMRRPQRGL